MELHESHVNSRQGGPADLRGRVFRRALTGLVAVILAGLAGGCGQTKDVSSTNSSNPPAAGDAVSIATDAYTFGYPLVLMDATRAVAAPVNTFDHGVLPNPNDRDVVRLNLDTLYSQAWIDVKDQPMVLQVPSMDGGRYWLMQILDAWTNTVHDPSSIDPKTTAGTSTTAPHTYVITGPNWKGAIPENATRLQMPTPTAWLIGRIQINGEADTANVQALQQQLKLVRLSDWTAGKQDGTVSRIHTTNPNTVPPVKAVAAMDGPTFFAKMNQLMATDAAATADAPAMARFATIGIKPGGTADASPADLNAAAAAAQKDIAAYQNPQTKNLNGWEFATNVGTYGTDYKQRAFIALNGLGANLPQDALYPSIFGDAGSNGAPRRFRIRFQPGQLPPADAFWSITAYSSDSFFVPNPAQIYAVGHQIPVTPGPDGSVEIAVQSTDPETTVPAGNWLPIPASGKFSLTMRLYAPKPAAIDGTWQPPALTPVK